MAELPTPLKAVVGFVASVADRLPPANELPEKALELPVLAVSAALQASLRVQQVYAELSARGDDVLSQLRGAPEHPPAWASFDDEPTDQASRTPGGPAEFDTAGQDRYDEEDPAMNSTSPSSSSASQSVHSEWTDDDADLTDDETQIPVDDRYEDVSDTRDSVAVQAAMDSHAPSPAGADHAAEYLPREQTPQAAQRPAGETGEPGRGPSRFDLAE
jgi:hypothetical protein